MQIARRELILGMASLPLAMVLADPRLSFAAAQSLKDVTLNTDGGSTVHAALAVPATTPAAAVMLVHEWWGLNDQIKSVAADLAGQGYLALAIDLYQGKVTADPGQARKLMGGVDPAAAADKTGSVVYLKTCANDEYDRWDYVVEYDKTVKITNDFTGHCLYPYEQAEGAISSAAETGRVHGGKDLQTSHVYFFAFPGDLKSAASAL